MLIETSGSNMEHDEDKLHKFLQKAMDKSIVCDGFVTNEPGKMKVSEVLIFILIHIIKTINFSTECLDAEREYCFFIDTNRGILLQI
jgi:hypothetical protein